MRREAMAAAAGAAVLALAVALVVPAQFVPDRVQLDGGTGVGLAPGGIAWRPIWGLGPGRGTLASPGGPVAARGRYALLGWFWFGEWCFVAALAGCAVLAQVRRPAIRLE